MLRPLAAAAIALALGTGTAAADTFALVPETPVAPSGPVVLPSADTPNASGSLFTGP